MRQMRLFPLVMLMEVLIQRLSGDMLSKPSLCSDSSGSMVVIRGRWKILDSPSTGR